MICRVVMVSPTPILEELVALVPDPGDRLVTSTHYGHVVSILTDHPDPDALRDELRDSSDGVATAVITGRLATEPARLVLCDVDSTFTTTEAVDLMAEYAGTARQVAEVTERAMRGELDFEQSLRARVATLRGLPITVLDEVRPRMTLSPGARELVETAHHAGAQIGLTSGGFTQLVGPLAEQHGLDFFNAIELGTEVVDGVERLSGEPVGPVVDRAQKARDLARFAEEHGVPMELTVAVGDGANDLDMLAAAAVGIAYCAKPVTAAAADVALGFPRLDAVAAFAFLR